jgi:uncharacterized membrane protein
MFANRRFPETFALVILMANVALAVYSYGALPAVVPTHFGPLGQLGNYAPKSRIWIDVGISVAVYIAFTLAARIPIQYANVPVKLTDENRDRVADLLYGLLSWIKAWTQVIFYALTEMVIRAATTSRPQFALTMVEYAATLALLLTCGSYIMRMRSAA